VAIDLHEIESELTEEFGGETEMVGISCGDVYDGGRGVASYVAAWYPRSLRELVMLETVGAPDWSGVWQPHVAIAIRCPVGDASRFRLVEAREQPWGDLLAECLRPDQVPGDALAARGLELAPEILAGDPAIARYLASRKPIAVDPADVSLPDVWRKPVPEAPDPQYVAPEATLSLEVSLSLVSRLRRGRVLPQSGALVKGDTA
jgi:hypothetical protein